MPRRYGQNKFNASRVEYDGEVFDSKRERDHYIELKRLEQGGFLRGLRRQVKFYFNLPEGPLKIRSGRYKEGRRVSYIADFEFVMNGKRVVQDVKGMDTDVSRLKRALVEAVHGVRVQVVKNPGELMTDHY